MEAANRAFATLMKVANNDIFLDVCLVGSFAALCVRSVNQQKYIEGLEAEKDSLVKSNKATKKAMWDWKQQLFAEAASDSALLPLAKLKVIYGEAPAPQPAEERGDEGSPVPLLVPGLSHLSASMCACIGWGYRYIKSNIVET